MNTVTNTLEKNLWGQTTDIVRILDQSWTNTNAFIYMRNLNISYFSSFGGRKGKTKLAIALLGLKTPPPLVENWMLWSKGKVALIVPVGFLRKISKYGNPCWNSDRPDDVLAKLITKDAKLITKDKRKTGFSQDNALWYILWNFQLEGKVILLTQESISSSKRSQLFGFIIELDNNEKLLVKTWWEHFLRNASVPTM